MQMVMAKWMSKGLSSQGVSNFFCLTRFCTIRGCSREVCLMGGLSRGLCLMNPYLVASYPMKPWPGGGL